MQTNKTNKSRKIPVSEIGIVLILVGIGILFNKFVPFANYFPFNAIFHISTLLVIVGLVRGFNTKFKGIDWIIILSIGLVLLFKKLVGSSFLTPQIFVPIVLIVIGFKLIYNNSRKNRAIKQLEEAVNDSPVLPFDHTETINQVPPSSSNFNFQYPQDSFATQNDAGHSSNNNQKNTNSPYEHDVVNMETFFGSNTKMVISKNFKGGNISVAFGNSNLILTKAEISGTIYIDVFCMFGELNLVVPSEFTIINNVTSILGEVADKRNFLTESNPNNTIVVRGQVIAGSIKLKNF